jgi:hypothetical protein
VLGEHPAQVERDRSGRDPQLCGDVRVRHALGDQAGDLSLHGRQRDLRRWVALARSLPGGPQLRSRAFDQRLCDQVFEGGQGCPEVDPRLGAPLRAPQELAVRQLRLGPFDRTAAAPVVVEGPFVVLGSRLRRSEQRSSVLGRGERPRQLAGVGVMGELPELESGLAWARPPGPRR